MIRWTKEAVLGAQEWGRDGTEEDKETQAAREVVRAKDEYRKSMRDWYFAAKHKARVEEKEKRRREMYAGKGKGKKEKGIKGKGKGGVGGGGAGERGEGKDAHDRELKAIRVLVRSDSRVGENALHFPIDLRLTVGEVLAALVERGELPRGADHETHAVMVVAEEEGVG